MARPSPQLHAPVLGGSLLKEEATSILTQGATRRFVVVLEAGQDLLALVDEIEDEGLLLAGVGAVEPGQGLRDLDATQALVNVQGGWSKPVCYLLATMSTW